MHSCRSDVEGQLSLFDAPDEGITQEEIDKALGSGGGFERSQIRIYHWFKLGKTASENIRWLKEEYGTGGMYPAYPAPPDEEIGLDYRAEGLRVWKHGNEKYFEKKVPWEYVEKKIREAVSDGRYLPKSAPDFPCLTCIFDKMGVCTHDEGDDWYCVNGSFRIPEDQATCPKCGKRLVIIQDNIGPDSGQCNRCGTRVIFSNQGNRPSAYDLWKRGELIGK